MFCLQLLKLKKFFKSIGTETLLLKSKTNCLFFKLRTAHDCKDIWKPIFSIALRNTVYTNYFSELNSKPKSCGIVNHARHLWIKITYISWLLRQARLWSWLNDHNNKLNHWGELVLDFLLSLNLFHTQMRIRAMVILLREEVVYHLEIIGLSISWF